MSFFNGDFDNKAVQLINSDNFLNTIELFSWEYEILLSPVQDVYVYIEKSVDETEIQLNPKCQNIKRNLDLGFFFFCYVIEVTL